VPERGGAPLAAGASARPAARGVLPRGLHAARADCRHRLSEQGADLRLVIRCGRPDAAHHRADPKHLGARLGATLVLHTWGSALTHHPHVHGIVPGGGLSAEGTHWVPCRRGFFLSVRVLSRLFRRRFLEALDQLHRSGRLQFFGEHAALADARTFAAWLAPLQQCEWVVYAKRPFAGPAAVLAYLSRYTHRVAISNGRLLALPSSSSSPPVARPIRCRIDAADCSIANLAITASAPDAQIPIAI
jgi:hypothetical protein